MTCHTCTLLGKMVVTRLLSILKDLHAAFFNLQLSSKDIIQHQNFSFVWIMMFDKCFQPENGFGNIRQHQESFLYYLLEQNFFVQLHSLGYWSAPLLSLVILWSIQVHCETSSINISFKKEYHIKYPTSLRSVWREKL